jgi:hypothetical protein
LSDEQVAPVAPAKPKKAKVEQRVPPFDPTGGLRPKDVYAAMLPDAIPKVHAAFDNFDARSQPTMPAQYSAALPDIHAAKREESAKGLERYLMDRSVTRKHREQLAKLDEIIDMRVLEGKNKNELSNIRNIRKNIAAHVEALEQHQNYDVTKEDTLTTMDKERIKLLKNPKLAEIHDGLTAGAYAENTLPVDADGHPYGAPEVIKTRAHAKELVMRLALMSLQGIQGLFWYHGPSRAILNMFGGSVEHADKFIQAVAITSPQTPIENNWDKAMRAWAQYQHAIKTGVYVPIDCGGTQMENLNLERCLYLNQPWSGRKTSNFYINLMAGIDPEHVAELLGRDSNEGVTADVHVHRSMGYQDKYKLGDKILAPKDEVDANGKKVKAKPASFTALQYAFTQQVYKIVARKLSAETGRQWTPSMVQAAVWTSQRMTDDKLPSSERRAPTIGITDFGNVGDVDSAREDAAAWGDLKQRKARGLPNGARVKKAINDFMAADAEVQSQISSLDPDSDEAKMLNTKLSYYAGRLQSSFEGATRNAQVPDILTPRSLTRDFDSIDIKGVKVAAPGSIPSADYGTIAEACSHCTIGVSHIPDGVEHENAVKVLQSDQSALDTYNSHMASMMLDLADKVGVPFGFDPVEMSLSDPGDRNPIAALSIMTARKKAVPDDDASKQWNQFGISRDNNRTIAASIGFLTGRKYVRTVFPIVAHDEGEVSIATISPSRSLSRGEFANLDRSINDTYKATGVMLAAVPVYGSNRFALVPVNQGTDGRAFIVAARMAIEKVFGQDLSVGFSLGKDDGEVVTAGNNNENYAHVLHSAGRSDLVDELNSRFVPARNRLLADLAGRSPARAELSERRGHSRSHLGEGARIDRRVGFGSVPPTCERRRAVVAAEWARRLLDRRALLSDSVAPLQVPGWVVDEFRARSKASGVATTEPVVV